MSAISLFAVYPFRIKKLKNIEDRRQRQEVGLENHNFQEKTGHQTILTFLLLTCSRLCQESGKFQFLARYWSA